MTLNWTGERFVPGVGPEIAYEHYSRYHFAKQFCVGKRVLDCPSGEGFGSNILREVAAQVIGVDVSNEAVQHAQSKYANANRNLSFQVANMGSLEGFEPHSFDVITCFEGIEHVGIDVQVSALKRFKELLVPGGLLIMSSPNKTYTDLSGQTNEFHIKEFYFDEFKKFLGTQFGDVEVLGQACVDSAIITKMTNGLPGFNGRFYVSENGVESVKTHIAEEDSYVYFVGLCSENLKRAAGDYSGEVILDLKRRSLESRLKELQILRDVQTKQVTTLLADCQYLSARLDSWKYRLVRAVWRIATFLPRQLTLLLRPRS